MKTNSHSGSDNRASGTDRFTQRPLKSIELDWIEAQVPSIKNPFAKLLILILLLHIRRSKNRQCGSHPSKINLTREFFDPKRCAKQRL